MQLKIRNVRPPAASAADVVVNERTHEVFAGGQVVKMARKEFAIMLSLARAAGGVQTRDDLLESAWGIKNASRCNLDTRTVDQHISRTRRRLGRYGPLLVTVSGHGYRVDPNKVALAIDTMSDNHRVAGKVSSIRRRFGNKAGATMVLEITGVAPTLEPGAIVLITPIAA